MEYNKIFLVDLFILVHFILTIRLSQKSDNVAESKNNKIKICQIFKISLSLSHTHIIFSLSLSHRYTHTHTQTRTLSLLRWQNEVPSSVSIIWIPTNLPVKVEPRRLHPIAFYIRDNFKHSFDRVIVVLELSFWTLWKAEVQTYKWV